MKTSFTYLFPAFPIAFLLVTRKTRNLYNSVMRLILQTYKTRFRNAPVAIVDVISDYDLSLMRAVPDIILRLEARGCWFHYGQAIMIKSR